MILIALLHSPPFHASVNKDFIYLFIYDSHLFIKKLARKNGEYNSCIPKNEEKYISISRQVIVEEYEKKEKDMDKVKQMKVTREFGLLTALSLCLRVWMPCIRTCLRNSV